ncbi:MAG: hypothetical protein M3R58_10215 [Pseudomonadota bacterium]|nr:hypothetical protein [Pseudomonadota bacterium]
MLAAMGKLAQRYGDAARSGVYRVRDADIPRAAAVEADAFVLEIGVAALADGGWPQVEEAMHLPPARACVVLIPDAAALARSEHHGTLEALHIAAQGCRDADRPFFAVLVDPDGCLALPPLYHERATE